MSAHTVVRSVSSSSSSSGGAGGGGSGSGSGSSSSSSYSGSGTVTGVGSTNPDILVRDRDDELRRKFLFATDVSRPLVGGAGSCLVGSCSRKDSMT